MWRAIILGCVLALATATAAAGERSPGNDLMRDGGPRDRREAREERYRDLFSPPGYRRPHYDPYYSQPRYAPRYVPRYVPRYNPWALYDKCLWQYADTFHCQRYIPYDSGPLVIPR